ncbi:MAG TPA: hypothetical protein VN578_17295 [Candidatus Binatia bacterium]|jgi:hypothetical protein|nr:hypothetical protein [Candidatus Binatia bacterium]
MKQLDFYWHIYRRDQIKPELRGNLVYLLQIPATLGTPVVRHVFDPRGVDFPASPGRRFAAGLVKNQHHGILYDGVSKAAVCDLRLEDPKLSKADPRFAFYNREVVCKSRDFFLIDPVAGLETMPDHTVRLLCGQNAILEKWNQPRISEFVWPGTTLQASRSRAA